MMSKPISRDDCTYLPVNERFYLTLSAIDMIEEELEEYVEYLLEDCDDEQDFEDIHEIIGVMRTDAYSALLQTMTLAKGDGKLLTTMIRLHENELKKKD